MGAEDLALGWLIHNTIGGPKPGARAPTPGEWNCMTRGISANIELMQQAADYVAAPTADSVDYLLRRLQFEVGVDGAGFLGQNETLSPTYGEWHLASWAAVYRAAFSFTGDEHPRIRVLSAGLLNQWFALLERLCMWGVGQPQTELMTGPAIASPGMRSQAGFHGSPVLARMLAWAARVNTWNYSADPAALRAYQTKPWWQVFDIVKWSGWRATWRYGQNELIRLYARQARLPVKLTILRGAEHRWIASFMDRNVNNNTPPCMAAYFDQRDYADRRPGMAIGVGDSEQLTNTFGLTILQPTGWSRPVAQPSSGISAYREGTAIVATNQKGQRCALGLASPPVEAATEVYGEGGLT